MEKKLEMANNADLKLVVKVVADGMLLASQVGGGLSLAELNTLIQTGKDVSAMLANPAVLWPEFKALDSAAQADLVAYINANIQFPQNVAVEVFAQKLLDVIVSLSSVAQLISPA